MSDSPPVGDLDEGKRLLKAAQAAHAGRKIDEALSLARESVGVSPALADAWVYLGTTLVTRRLAFDEGLAALEHAVALAPRDPGAYYSLGWCEDFIAYRLTRAPATSRHTPESLFERAAEHLKQCLDLDPETKLREDAEDLLAALEARR
jgi:tetratricopeptide (TPR) repeat protein